MTRVLVTGAAGFIGSHVAEALIERGEQVVGIDNFDPFYARATKERNLSGLLQAPGFTFHEIDILDGPALRSLLGPDTLVIHLAAKAGVRPSLASPDAYAKTNLMGTASLIEAARDAGVSRIVFGSSSSVYGDDTPSPFREDVPAVTPVSPYAATKRGGELVLESVAPHFGLRVAAVRLFTVYGPRQRPDLAIHLFARLMAARQPITLFGDGTQARDYTYCSDIVAGILAAAAWTEQAPAGMEIFNLGGARAVPLRDMVEVLSREMGTEPIITWQPMQPGDVRNTAADLTKSERVLGYRPEVPFEEGIRRFVAWLREHHDPER
jgi:UDP-glucuronate 4-epimerase